MIKTAWRRINDNKNEYVPGRDSPENHYINDAVINMCIKALTYVKPQYEEYVEPMRAMFVYGDTAQYTRKNQIPQTLHSAIHLCYAAVCRQYRKEWGRTAYEEELAAIFDAANKVR